MKTYKLELTISEKELIALRTVLDWSYHNINFILQYIPDDKTIEVKTHLATLIEEVELAQTRAIMALNSQTSPKK